MNEHTDRTQDRTTITASRGLQGVREAAQRDKGLRFTTLLHHVSEKRLLDSFYLLKKQAAPGVDQVTWSDYEEGVEARITDLHDRIHRGAYRAQPSRRVYIPKPDGRQRPLGIAALEDKIVQMAVVEVLNQIYEEDFAGFSYGFRPERSAHDALDSLGPGAKLQR
jgi:RNA-directed DNA polymerase